MVVGVWVVGVWVVGVLEHTEEKVYVCVAHTRHSCLLWKHDVGAAGVLRMPVQSGAQLSSILIYVVSISPDKYFTPSESCSAV